MFSSIINSPLGDLLLVCNDHHLLLCEFYSPERVDAQLEALRRYFDHDITPGQHAILQQANAELNEYFSGRRQRFTLPLSLLGSPFQQQVWQALLAIPYGHTRSYADIAHQIGQPDAVRAVGMANGQNRLAIVIPCHRVINESGALGGYGGGLARKQWLLDLETGRPQLNF